MSETITQHEKLIRILNMINRCERYVEGDRYRARLMMGQLRDETERRINFRLKVINRLQKYYAKKLFALASQAYNNLQPQPTGANN